MDTTDGPGSGGLSGEGADRPGEPVFRGEDDGPATAEFRSERGRAARAAGRRRRWRLGVAACCCVGLASATLIQSFSWNQTSHYDLIRSLNVERTAITPYADNTGDKVEYPKGSGTIYSARAPGLALFSLPFYDALNLVGAESWTRSHVAPPDHPGDEMIYLIGLWANVLPGLLLLLLVLSVANRFEPGYGAAAAVVVGLGTLVLPLSTLLFSHVFTTFLGFFAFWLMLRERDGPPSLLLLGLAGLSVGYAVASEYPVFLVALVLGVFLLSRRDSFNVRGVATRAGAYILGGVVGIIPLLLYNHYAFHSWTHLAYENVKRQEKGFFGITAPSLKVASTLLFDSRGLLTISPVLIMGAVGTVLLYRRGRRAEALTIGGIVLCYVTYNSGYFLPFGGGFMGPRFLTTMIPFLACPLGMALKRFPGPTLTLAGASIALTVIATITHPLVGYETETVIWWHLISHEVLQPTIASAYGLGRGWGGMWVFLLPAVAGVVLGTMGTRRVRLTAAGAGWGLLALLAWALFAVLAPRLLGIDHAGLESIYKAGDHTAFSSSVPTREYSTYPLREVVPVAAAAGLVALGAFGLLRNRRGRPDRARGAPAQTRTEPALSG
jgi:hypothetical protein